MNLISIRNFSFQLTKIPFIDGPIIQHLRKLKQYLLDDTRSTSRVRLSIVRSRRG